MTMARDNGKRMTKNQWKNIVTKAVDQHNKSKLVKNSITETPQTTKINTKTKHIHKKLTTEEYTRKPISEILNRNKQQTKSIILARNGMLECGKNFKGTMRETCRVCDQIDNENHRLNICTQWIETNNIQKADKPEFSDIYSEDGNTLDKILTAIESVWELKYASGKMKR